MRLYFLRHGIAGDREGWQGDDFDRPLTEEGRERMILEAAAIARLDLAIDVILTSPLVRAVQTAEIVAARLSMMDKLVRDERLGPNFGPGLLSEMLKSHPSANALMLVGHEPGQSETIRALIGGGRIVNKKGALTCVNVPDRSHLRGELEWLLPPKALVL